MRVFRNDYIHEWETKRQHERDDLLQQGKRPYKTDLAANEAKGTPLNFLATYPIIYGQSCGGIDAVLPAAEILLSMVAEARDIIKKSSSFLAPSRL